MNATEIDALRVQVAALATATSVIGMASTGPELLLHEDANVSAEHEPTDEQEMQKWRAVDRELWNAYNALRLVGRSLAELSWLAQRTESGAVDPAVQLQNALAQIKDLEGQVAALQTTQPATSVTT